MSSRAGRIRPARGAIATSDGPGRAAELAERHGVATGGRTRSVRLSVRSWGTKGRMR